MDDKEFRRLAAPLLQLLADDTVRDRLTRKLDAAIIAEVPELGADPSIRQDLRASSLATFRTYLDGFTGPAIAAAPPELRGLGSTLARRGLDVGPVLRAFRVGQRVFWLDVMELALGLDLDERGRHDLLSALWDYMSRNLDAGAEEVVASHNEEMQRQWQGSTARRLNVITSLLAGEPADLDRASADLGYRLRDRHLGLVVWGDDELPGETVAEALDAAVRSVADLCGSSAPLTMVTGVRSAWAWVPVPGDFAAVGLSSLALELPAGVHVALGVPESGTTGFRSTHEEAVRAQGVAVLGRPGTVTYYGDVELVSLLTRDRRAMRLFVRRQLAGLATGSADVARLRETLLVYLESGSSQRAATALNVHKNTVLYRLAQAEELLGRTVNECGPALHVALQTAAALGSYAWADPE